MYGVGGEKREKECVKGMYLLNPLDNVWEEHVYSIVCTLMKYLYILIYVCTFQTVQNLSEGIFCTLRNICAL